MITAPLIWSVVPGLAGFIFWFLRKRSGLLILLSTILCLLLAVLAWLLPIGQSLHLGPLNLTVDSTLAFAGRKLVIENHDRVFLTFVYILCAFWFAGSAAAGANLLLIPFGLGIVALLVAAQSVEPFLYAALLIEMAVLLAIPVLAPPGKNFGQGVLRFLIFQTLAMPFILLAGWVMGGVETNPSNQTLVTFSMVFLGLGFAFWLAAFPFYTWIPLLAEQSYPYAVGFVLLLLPTFDLLIGLIFIDRFSWLRVSAELFQLIRLLGTLMVVTAGLWAAFQKDMARLLGYGVIVETGFSLLAISLSSTVGNQLFASMFLPRTIGLGLWALSLSILLREARSTRFDSMQGLAQRLPFASAGLAVASLTLAGLPLLAVFPIRQVLLEELARESLWNALWALAGTVGMLFSTFRALAVLAHGLALPGTSAEQAAETKPQSYCESRTQIALLLGGMIGLLLIGLFPQAFLPMLNGLLKVYPQLP